MLDLDYKDVAEKYGGNKQKIAQAAAIGALGPEGPLLAVTAGMYIDRMRAAQMAEQAPQQTVAQQVLAPSQMPVAPQMPPQGLGAAAPQGMPQGMPEGMPPMAAEAPVMDMPPAQGMAEGGYLPPYASGGLTDLPLPDGMFDEPSNGGYGDGYANGGLVAFAAGDAVRTPEGWGEYFEQIAAQTVPGVGTTSRKRSAADNARVGGQTDSYHLLGAARDFTPPAGMTMGQLHQKLASQFGGAYDVINEGDHIHVEPGPQLGASVRKGLAATPAGGAAATPAAPAAPATPAPLEEDLVNAFPGLVNKGRNLFDDIMPERKTEGLEMIKDESRETLDPENQKKAKDQDMWATLAEIGFNMAASNSPYFLQAVGAAAATALPGAKEAKKAREAERRQAIRDYAEVEGIEYEQAEKKAKFGLDYAKDMTGLKTAALARALDRYQIDEQIRMGMRNTDVQAAASRYSADAGVRGATAAADKSLQALEKQATNNAFDAAVKAVAGDPRYNTAVAKGDTATAQAILAPVYEYYLNIARGNGASAAPSYGAPPPGSVKKVQ